MLLSPNVVHKIARKFNFFIRIWREVVATLRAVLNHSGVLRPNYNFNLSILSPEGPWTLLNTMFSYSSVDGLSDPI